VGHVHRQERLAPGGTSAKSPAQLHPRIIARGIAHRRTAADETAKMGWIVRCTATGRQPSARTASHRKPTEGGARRILCGLLRLHRALLIVWECAVDDSIDTIAKLTLVQIGSSDLNRRVNHYPHALWYTQWH